MTFKNNFVAVVKCNNNVLREMDDQISLPFSLEYSLLLKNLSSRKASVSVNIDGQDVLYGNSLIISPNSEFELMGFLHGSQIRNKFKFIQKTKQIQNHRGDRIDDGIIRIEYAFEKTLPEVKTIIHEHRHRRRDYYYDYLPPLFSPDIRWTSTDGIKGDSVRNIGASLTNFSSDNSSKSNYCCNNIADNTPQQDEGITVKGSNVQQDFQYVSIGELEQSDVIVLRLRGVTEKGVSVNTPVTVKTKVTCPTCGKKSKSYRDFCSRCGTCLKD